MVEAHTHFSWNDQPSLDAIQRMPPEEHILWCAEVAKKLPRHGLDQLRRRRRRQAAAGRRDPQRDQRRHHHRPALPRREPGDHGARRPRRHDPAAPAAARVRVRRDRQRPARDAPLRAHVRQVRRRLVQDQPVRRVDHRHAQRGEPVHRRGDRGPASTRPRPGASASPRTRARPGRSSSACKHGIEVIYHASFTRRRSARHARGAQVRALHRARAGLADQHLAPRDAVGPDARSDAQDGLPPRARRRRSRA